MSELHDFNDGRGPVPAHQHNNPAKFGEPPDVGGWIDDTAEVSRLSRVDVGAQVLAGCVIPKACRVETGAIVGPDVTLQLGSVVAAGVRLTAPPFMWQGSRHLWVMVDTDNRLLQAGCKANRFSLAYWHAHVDEIAAAAKYSPAHAANARSIVDEAIAIFGLGE